MDWHTNHLAAFKEAKERQKPLIIVFGPADSKNFLRRRFPAKNKVYAPFVRLYFAVSGVPRTLEDRKFLERLFRDTSIVRFNRDGTIDLSYVLSMPPLVMFVSHDEKIKDFSHTVALDREIIRRFSYLYKLKKLSGEDIE